MTSKCGKNKKVAHEPQASVSLMLLPHFDVFCDLLLNRRTATWNLFVLYNEQKGNTTNLPRSAWLFDLCQFRHFQSHQRYFPWRLLLFFFIVLVNSFLLFFSKAFACSKQNNLINISKTVSLFVALTAVLKICSSLGIFKLTRTLSPWFFLFLVCKQLLLNFSRGLHLVNSN